MRRPVLLGTGSAFDHLIVAKKRAVEKQDVGTLDPLHHCGRSLRRRLEYR
jgi:hypothetical protein